MLRPFLFMELLGDILEKLVVSLLLYEKVELLEIWVEPFLKTSQSKIF